MTTFKMKAINTGLVVMTGFMLAACGGGGGGSSDGTALENTQVAGSTSSAETASTTETTVEPVAAAVSNTPATAVSSTEDLVVTETFLFSSNFKLRVAANMASTFDHLTVCYTKDGADSQNSSGSQDNSGAQNGTAMADYDNCLLRAGLDEGVFNGELLVTNDTNYLAVSAWDYEDAENPSVTYWDRDIDGDLISVN